MGGETNFGSDPKGAYKSELQSPLEPHKEEENKATPPGCEPENLVEEQDTLVSLLEDGKVKKMENKSYDIFRIHLHIQPYYQWKYKKYSLASKDCKRKANCEGDQFTPSFPVGDHTISEKKSEGVKVDNMVNESFGSYPKEE